MLLALLVLGEPALAADAPKGAARRWEASLPVGLYGQVNLRTGRVLTTIPITGWSGRGPSIQFNLYHNQVSAWGPIGIVPGDGDLDELLSGGDFDPMLDIVLTPPEEQTPLDLAIGDFDGSGIVDATDMGEFLDALEGGGAAAASGGGSTEPCTPDWRHSYSAKVELSLTGVWLTRDDGTVDAFTWDETDPEYERLLPPPGVFDTMYYDYEHDDFILVSKNQWKAYFNWHEATPDWYRLESITDAALLANGDPANRVICHYDGEISHTFTYGKLISVEDATRAGPNNSGRELVFSYNSLGKLKEITDPINRHWKLLYEVSGDPNNPAQEGTGYLRAVEDPMTYRTTVTYNGTCDLASVADKNGDAYGFEYHNGRLLRITDPAPFTAHQQVFSYYKIMFSNDQFCEYTDRRGVHWYTMFDTVTGNIVEVEDPLGHPQSLDYDDLTVHPTMHEAVIYADALNHEWEFAWDTNGNLLYAQDPTNRITHYQYDELNNLTRITPPGETQGGQFDMVLQYQVPAIDPTAVTRMVVPPPDGSSSVSNIDLTYNTVGDIRTLKDANGVLHTFNYGPFGELMYVAEGRQDDPLIGSPGKIAKIHDASGRPLAMATVGFNFILSYGSVTLNPELALCVTGAASPPDAGNRNPQDCCADCVLTCFEISEPPGWYLCEKGRTDCNNATTETFPPYESPEPNPQTSSYLPPTMCPQFGGISEPYGPSSRTFDNMGQVLTAEAQLSQYLGQIGFEEHSTILGTATYDSLGRSLTSAITSNEHTFTGYDDPGRPIVTRNISNGFQLAAQGTITQTGTDGQTTTIQFDTAGRPTSVSRNGLSASVTYYTTDQIEYVTYGNGTRTHYQYDDAQRISQIRHETTGGSYFLQLDYTFTPRGLIETVTETAPNDGSATIIYSYDKRDQLIGERRQGFAPFWYTYTYDSGGNRKSKMKKDANTGLIQEVTTYFYDVDNPYQYGTWSNRLLYYEVRDASQSLIETTYYRYKDGNDGEQGNVTMVIRKSASDPVYRATQMGYTKSGEVRIAATMQWELGQNNQCLNKQLNMVSETRGSGRARYMQRFRQVSNVDLIQANTSRWTDYDGDEAYADYKVDVVAGNAVVTALIAYLPGIGQKSGSFELYYHADHLGSTRLLTNENGDVVYRFVYTAFGESVPADNPPQSFHLPRYQYAGAWGYELTTISPYLHVGYRWYDPSSGRFLQRDPIGIDCGLNTYAYCENRPIDEVDPLGLEIPAPSGPRSWYPYDHDRKSNPLDPVSHCAGFLTLTGGYGHVPVMDPGPAQDRVLISADIASWLAPTGIGVLRGASSLSKFKAFRFINQNRYIRIGPGKWPGVQGRIPAIRIGTGKQWWSHWRS